MTTIALKQPRVAVAQPVIPMFRFNRYAIGALLTTSLFVGYFIIPHVGPIAELFRFSVLFIVFMPLIAFVLSAMAVRQLSHGRNRERGKVVSYIALGITSLYFITGLAIPIVLVGMYVLYAYII